MNWLENKPFDELVKAKKELDALIEKRRMEGMAKLISSIRTQIQDSGFTLPEVLKELKAIKSPTAKVVYAHPSIPGLSWSGKGRQPKWISDAINQGALLEDFRVKS